MPNLDNISFASFDVCLDSLSCCEINADLSTLLFWAQSRLERLPCHGGSRRCPANETIRCLCVSFVVGALLELRMRCQTATPVGSSAYCSCCGPQALQKGYVQKYGVLLSNTPRCRHVLIMAKMPLPSSFGSR